MQVIAERRKARNIEGENPVQFFHSFPDLLFAVGVVPSGTAIHSTETRASHAPIEQMERLDLSSAQISVRFTGGMARSFVHSKTDIPVTQPAVTLAQG